MLSHKTLNIIYISKNRHAVITNTEMVIRNSKNQEEKTFAGGKQYALFKIKNAQLLAHVYIAPTHLRPKFARRNAIDNAEITLPNGNTTLIHSESLEVIAEIPYPLLHPVLMLEKQVIVGMCGSNVLCYNLDNKTHMIESLFCDVRECIAIDNDHFVLLHSNFSSSNLFFLSIDRSGQITLGSDSRFSNISNMCVLSDNQFFIQCAPIKHLCDFAIYKTGRFQEINLVQKRRKLDIKFVELLLLPDEATIIARIKDGSLYLIDTARFNMDKLSVNVPSPIIQLVLDENEKLWAYLNNGSYYDLEALISQKKEIARDLTSQTPLPRVLIDIVVDYAGDRRFFKSPKPALAEEKQVNLKLNGPH